MCTYPWPPGLGDEKCVFRTVVDIGCMQQAEVAGKSGLGVSKGGALSGRDGAQICKQEMSRCPSRHEDGSSRPSIYVSIPGVARPSPSQQLPSRRLPRASRKHQRPSRHSTVHAARRTTKSGRASGPTPCRRGSAASGQAEGAL